MVNILKYSIDDRSPPFHGIQVNGMNDSESHNAELLFLEICQEHQAQDSYLYISCYFLFHPNNKQKKRWLPRYLFPGLLSVERISVNLFCFSIKPAPRQCRKTASVSNLWRETPFILFSKFQTQNLNLKEIIFQKLDHQLQSKWFDMHYVRSKWG